VAPYANGWNILFSGKGSETLLNGTVYVWPIIFSFHRVVHFGCPEMPQELVVVVHKFDDQLSHYLLNYIVPKPVESSSLEQLRWFVYFRLSVSILGLRFDVVEDWTSIAEFRVCCGLQTLRQLVVHVDIETFRLP
jgi:hypothetical protein